MGREYLYKINYYNNSILRNAQRSATACATVSLETDPFKNCRVEHFKVTIQWIKFTLFASSRLFDALIALSSRYPVDKVIHVKAGRITWPGHMQVR